MFALSKRRRRSQDHTSLRPISVCDEVSDPTFSSIPSSLLSSACPDDFGFSPSSYVAEASTLRPTRLAPSLSSSYFYSPLRKAMKMSGVLEQPSSDPPSSSELEPDQRIVAPHSALDFTRQDVRPFTSSSSSSQPKEPSGLTQLLSSPAPPITNPFSETVGLTLLKTNMGGIKLKITVYFPHAESPAGEPIELTLHEEATIEELIGMALWTYWENGWIPQLSINHTEFAPKLSLRNATSGWVVYPVRHGFVDRENGGYGSSDRVRLLDGVVEFAVLRASEDDYRLRATPPLGHRKSYSMPSYRMSLLPMPSRKKGHGSLRDPLRRSVTVRNDSDGSPDILEAPVYSDIQNITRKACKMFNMSYTEDMTLMAVDVQKTLREVPSDSRLSSFSDDVEFTLVSRKKFHDPSSRGVIGS